MQTRYFSKALATIMAGILYPAVAISADSDTRSEMSLEKHSKATFGGGCFWCVEAVFEEMEGVAEVISGYAGGERANPSYEEVCSGRTGHAEVVQISFDPGKVSFSELLDHFFATHDPTTLNRQGADVGSQYRSVIFYQDEDQRQAALAKIRELDQSGAFDQPVVTEVEPLPEFYRAEGYHQDYFAKNPNAPYCRIVIAPKLEKARKHLEKSGG